MTNQQRLNADVCALEAADLPVLRDFLMQAFDIHQSPSNWRDQALQWKCITPHPWWPKTRAFARYRDQQMTAAGVLVPIRMQTPSGVVSCGHVIDWGGSSSAPGAGIQLYLALASIAGPVFGIGGSVDTRKILPRIGARVIQRAAVWSRLLRPLRALKFAPMDWKTPARLARNVVRSWPSVASPSGDWHVDRVANFEDAVGVPFPEPDRFRALVPERSVALLNYWLACPCAQVSGYVLRRGSEAAGYFLLSELEDRCCIADLWVAEDTSEMWTQAYRAAFHAALRDTQASRIVTMNSLEHAGRALASLGFRKSENDVFLLDPQQKLPSASVVALTMADFDGFYVA